MASTDYNSLNRVEKPVNPRPLETGNRFTWEQLEMQLKPLGIRKESLSPEDMRELLNARRTSSLTLNQTDSNGTTTPVQGRLFVYDDPGKGPRVEMIPRQLERTPAPRFLGYQLTHEDHIRLQRTGELGRPVPLTDKETNQQFMGLVGYDPQTNRLTVFRQERFVPPTVLRNVPITDKQQQTLKNHGVIRVKNMTGLDGKPFTADVQVAAHKRGLKFTPVNQAALNALQEKRDTQRNAPQPADLTPKQVARQAADEQWKKTVVSAKDENGQVVRKPAGALTYQDMIRVNKASDSPVEWRPLNRIPHGQELKSPRAQAKMEILDYRKEQNGVVLPPKKTATAEEIKRADQKFSSLSEGRTPARTATPPSPARQNEPVAKTDKNTKPTEPIASTKAGYGRKRV